MGWSMEMAAVRTTDLDEAVPHLFSPAGGTTRFEGATSMSRPPEMCAALVGGWAVVIDVEHRLSENAGHLRKASRATDVHLVRVDEVEPAALHYRAGTLVSEAVPESGEDGESWAMRTLRERTGIHFGEGPSGLWDVNFQVLAVTTGLRIDESTHIPEGALRWELPGDPSDGRADPTLGGFTTELSVDTTTCPGLDAGQRQRIRERVARHHRDGDVIVANSEGTITVLVDWIVTYPESADLARARAVATLREALMP
ncbi:hypothetical protein [Streptomyces sedi]|uniref:Uncharacterized protein n=1 Tax=Streptomyces sedi TaxID=555059 RepID=A0A5C4V6C7_9ACTN|nr:hypothetical protein [Streptomyces sedi]TNM30629.1 hypothetical protein FH715_11545 [Streptomyces sedi]